MSDQKPVYVAKLHVIIFFWPVLLACFALFIAAKIEQLETPSFFLIIFTLVWGAVTLVNYRFSSVTIEKKKIIIQTGMLAREIIDIPLNKIESIDLRQSLFGSLVGYGSLAINGTGGRRYFIHYLDKPLTCRRYIEQLMHES